MTSTIFHTVLVPAVFLIIINVVGTEIKLIKDKAFCFPEATDNIIEFDRDTNGAGGFEW